MANKKDKKKKSRPKAKVPEVVIEGVKKGKYHMVDRWCPEEGAFREAALLLIKLSRLKIDEIYLN